MDPVFKWEVGHICYLRKQSKEDAEGYLKVVTDRRGKAEADELRAAAASQWSLGNRGAMWDWRVAN